MNRVLLYDVVAMMLVMVGLLIAHWQLVSGTDGFGFLFFLAFFPVHVLNFLTSGFNAGSQFELWKAGRKFRRAIPDTMEDAK